MQLNPLQLGEILHNVLSYSFDDCGGLHFHRFTQPQQDVYARESPEWAKKTRVSASVTFDFLTDSDHITLEFDLLPITSHQWASIDLYVDGIFFASQHVQDLRLKQAEFGLPAGQHRVTVYFPWSVETVVQGVHLSDGASVIPVEKKCKLLCFGDSITQGFVTKFSSLSYVNQIARALDAEVINQGVGGYYHNAATLDASLLAYEPDVITVAYGTNDYMYCDTPERFAEQSEKYLHKLSELYPNVKILGILPLYRNDVYYWDRRKNCSYELEQIRDILRSQYAALPNGYALEETGIPHIHQAYAPDFIHPNELGFCVMSQAVIEKLKEIISKS